MKLEPCALCGDVIAEGERSERYSYHDPDDARRVHSRCTAKLIKETLAAFARVPPEQRENMTFEI